MMGLGCINLFGRGETKEIGIKLFKNGNVKKK
jgi:hypothetical protein